MTTPLFVKRTLAQNVRHFRGERGLSQESLAEKAGLSLRIIQDVERARANPSLETIVAIAKGMRILHQRLMGLYHLTLSGLTQEEFEGAARIAFHGKAYGVFCRDLSGNLRWANTRCSTWKGIDLANGHADWLATFGQDMRVLLRDQARAERQGIVYPFTLLMEHEGQGDRLPFRCHPTLLFGESGGAPVLTLAFVTEIDQDCEEFYYDYCGTLLELAAKS